MKSPSIQVNTDAHDEDKKISPKITCPVLKLINIQDGNIGLQLQVPRGGTHPNGFGSKLTIFLTCSDLFLLQLVSFTVDSDPLKSTGGANKNTSQVTFTRLAGRARFTELGRIIYTIANIKGAVHFELILYYYDLHNVTPDTNWNVCVRFSIGVWRGLLLVPTPFFRFRC